MKTQLRSSKVQGFKVLGLILVLTFELLNPLNLERASAQTHFYQGKTITMVVASTTGGGYDLWARVTARHIVKYIPGNPSIVVQNMPGAGNIIGANYVYGVAKPDGLTLGAVNPALYFDQLVGRSEVKFDWAKFNWIGSPEKNDVVSYMRADTAVQDHRRSAQRQGTAKVRQHRHRLHRPLYSPAARRNSRHQNPDRQRLSRRPRYRIGHRARRSLLLVAAARYLLRPRALSALAQVRLRARLDANRRQARCASEGHSNAERADAAI